MTTALIRREREHMLAKLTAEAESWKREIQNARSDRLALVAWGISAGYRMAAEDVRKGEKQ